MRRLAAGVAVGVAIGSHPVHVHAQPSSPVVRRPLFTLELEGTPLDEFPDGVKALSGTMTVVTRDGRRMLQASSPSEFLITLPQVLPAEFTIEIEFIPKRCCAPDDIMLEGTPTRNRGVVSAELTWHPQRISAVGGGGEMYQANMPDDLAAVTPGNLTRLVLEFSGTSIKLYTNGRRLYTLEKQFVRGRVLRVWLGGESAANPMYLAGLRVGPGSAGREVIAGTAGLPGDGARMDVASDQAATNQSQLVAGTNRTVPNVAVTQGTGGPLVSWSAVGGATSYTVKRWKIDDQACCTRSSQSLGGPPWQDGALPAAGTYVFEVIASGPAWTATGQAQFVQFKTAGQIATVAPSGGAAPANPGVNSEVSGVRSGTAANTTVAKLLPSPPRTITLGGFAGAGGPLALPRTLTLAGIVASGDLTSVAPSNLSLSAMTATTPPRTVVLTGFAAAGNAQLASPRLLTLPGWSAVGVNP